MAADPKVGAVSLVDDNKSPLESGPFVLRPLLEDVPLWADDVQEHVKINCVDYLDRNLYVGTSASELLHFVQLPPGPAEQSNGKSAFILASRLRPAYSDGSATSNGTRPGVQQILLLPTVGKACVLCNWTVTFYSLPELSPVFGVTQVKNCSWIGGVDLNEGASNHGSNGVTILLSLNKRIQVVRIGEDARVVKKIDFAGSSLSVRRDSIACVADSRSYALLDVDRQLKIPLMSISSLDSTQAGGQLGQVQSIASGPDGGLSRSASSAQARPTHLDAQAAPGHSRSTSLGGFITGSLRRQEPKTGEVDDPVFQEPDPDPPALARNPMSAARPSSSQADTNKPLPKPIADAAGAEVERPSSTPAAGPAMPPAKPDFVLLRPHILSPTAEEFLLVTGTGPTDPGIGIFVNLDGDPTRPTVEFDKYPREVVTDGGSADLSASKTSLESEAEGYVLASTTKEFEDGTHYGLEIQRFDSTGDGPDSQKHWLEIKRNTANAAVSDIPLGVRSLLHSDDMNFPEVTDKLCQTRFSPFSTGYLESPTMSLRSMDSRTALSLERMSKEKQLFDNEPDSDEETLPEGWEDTRNRQEEEFASRLAKTTSRLAVWAGNVIWWAVRNPLLLQIESLLEASDYKVEEPIILDEQRREVLAILASFRSRDAKSELEFMTFGYIRQKAGIILLSQYLNIDQISFTVAEMNAVEEVLLEGGLDPRVVLALIPPLRNEIIESRRGIWIYKGIKKTIESRMALDKLGDPAQPLSALRPDILQFLRHFLTSWRKKKGFGSVADENAVFRTVDAALLRVLLELDQKSPPKIANEKGSVRSHLYDLVDRGVDCFDRAVDLLETYHRLYVLSRLYQSRKMSAEVLATWRRIIEGEQDDGGELKDGEQRVRGYLANISNQGLVQEYGLWLATRNPKLGVQVFADEKGRAPKFEPAQVVALLRSEAPDAVKYYLEHLVFGKGQAMYVNELILYYLDIVVSDLKASVSSRETVAATYEAYRALKPPKPTYRHFLTDNAPPEDEVWHSRLRLLQLLGGPHEYDAKSIRRRIATAFPGHADQLLVPEAIILDGREQQHEDALQLLVHRLGDYDTAVSYCLHGGSSIYTGSATRRETVPTQADLFRVLLREFLALEDLSDRVEQTGALLERFGGWFDVLEVLTLLPDSWSVDITAEFIAAALRRLVREKHESQLTMTLSSAENLRVNYDLITKINEKGPIADTEQ